MSRQKLILFPLVVAFLAIFTTASAQNSFGLRLEGRRKTISMPFELYNNLIVVKVKYNNFINLNFILDTGVRTAILTDVRVAMLLNPKFVRPIKIGGLGIGGELEAFIATGLDFSMPGLVGRDQLLVVLTEDVFSLSRFLGKEVHGLLGYEIFSRFVVDIDYRNKVLRLHEPSTFKYRGRGEVIPISVEDTKPFVQAEATCDGGKVPVKLIVDTGAGHALALYTDTHPGITMPKKVIRALLGRGMNGDIVGAMGRIPAFKLGNFVFRDVITSFPDSSALGTSLQANERHGNLGSHVLSRFRVVFDYSRSQMILKKYDKKDKKFYFNMSGLEIISEGQDLRKYIIDNVRAGSPAARCGIMKGDEVLNLNGKPAEAMKLSEINSFFQLKPGRLIKLNVKRGDAVYKFKFRLEELI